MIRIARPEVVPEVLQTRGRAERDNLVAAFEAGEAAFAFKSAIYAHDEVKSALRHAQHDKCCFCESRVTHIAYGDVEHFRPKAAVRQSDAGELEYPGYFWLAYEWGNLFFCCQLCNQRHKKNHFPLARPASRARRPDADLARERPLFVSPEEDPSPHLSFEEEYLLGLTRRGKTTIRALGLNREELATHRAAHLKTVRRFLDTLAALVAAIRASPEPHPDLVTQEAKLREHLDWLRADTAEYAAMVRAACAARPDLLS